MPLLLSLPPFAVSLSCQLVCVKRRGGNLGLCSFQGATLVCAPRRRWEACIRSSVAMGMDTAVVAEVDPPVVKAASDKRLYEVLKLPNGLSALLIHDPAMSGPQPEDERACGHGCGHDHHHHEDDDEEDDEDYEEGDEEDDDDEDDEEEDEDDDDDGMEVDGARGIKRGHKHVHKASCSNGDCEEECEDSEEDDEEEESDDDDDEDGPSHGAMQAPTKKAAAAMCVGVGSFSDPADAQGLAHFLEHMLFMGSEKFPDENEYDNFLSKHGGGSNAFTDTEFTCYHFEVSPNHLQPALDRFSQFFIAPLANPDNRLTTPYMFCGLFLLQIPVALLFFTRAIEAGTWAVVGGVSRYWGLGFVATICCTAGEGVLP